MNRRRKVLAQLPGVIIFICLLNSCLNSPSDHEISNLKNSHHSHALQTFFDDHPTASRHVIQQTLRIYIENPEWSGPGFFSSGFVISDRQMLTSAHAITHFVGLDENEKPYLKARTLAMALFNAEGEMIYRTDVELAKFIDSTDENVSFASAMRLEELGSDKVHRYADHDLAIVTLKRKTFSNIMGKYIQPFPLLLSPPHHFSKMYSLGYGEQDLKLRLHATVFHADENLALMMGERSEPSLYLRTVRVGHLPMRPGDSGGPLFMTDRNGNLNLIGINTSGRPWRGNLQDLFTSFRSEQVIKVLEAQKVPLFYTNAPSCFPLWRGRG